MQRVLFYILYTHVYMNIIIFLDMTASDSHYCGCYLTFGLNFCVHRIYSTQDFGMMYNQMDILSLRIGWELQLL